jgi:titin
LPSGFSINPATGVISGTTVFSSGTFATYSVSVTVTDSLLASANTVISLRINQVRPAAPTLLSATAPVAGQVVLSWTDNANNELGFQIQRATDVNFTVGLTTVYRYVTNLTTYTDTTVAPLTTYYYRVYSLNSSAFSATSANTSITTP